jgi:hypothetical protein
VVPSGSDDNLRFEIGHVLFIDIVGYSKLLIEEQKERLNQLTEIVLATAQVRDSTDEQLVRLPTDPAFCLPYPRWLRPLVVWPDIHSLCRRSHLGALHRRFAFAILRTHRIAREITHSEIA